ncbi:hypothetical protein GCK32_010389 [Trichostrongylus colubriformis]|uniref:Uncharacterized protein n=1 Tax=Trichostrongylus colubriformis TaxID=6319 RepID=A0AAN8IUR6_TRICO
MASRRRSAGISTGYRRRRYFESVGDQW